MGGGYYYEIYIKILLAILGLIVPFSAFPGAIYTVSKVPMGPKTVLLFHDIHVQGENQEKTENGISYAVGEIAKWQYRPFWHLFSHKLIENSQPSTMLIEWRPAGQEWHYTQLSDLLAKNGYTKDQLQSWLSQEDFFGRHYLWAYMCPKDSRLADDLTTNVTIINVDERDEDHDSVLDIFFKGDKVYSLAQDIASASGSKRKKLRQELNDQLQSYKKSKRIEHLLACGEHWIESFDKKLTDKLQKYTALFGPSLSQEVRTQIIARKNKCVRGLKTFTGSESDVRLLYNKITSNLNVADNRQFQELWVSFLNYTCILVDLEILAGIYQAKDSLVMVYCGSNHADAVVDHFRSIGHASSSLNLLKDKYMKDEMALEKALKDFVTDDKIVSDQFNSPYPYFSPVLNELARSITYDPFGFIRKRNSAQVPVFAHFAIEHNDEKMLKFLVDECHADINQRDYQGFTPRDLAVHFKDDATIAYLDTIKSC